MLPTLWGVLFFVVAWLAGPGIRMGLGAMVTAGVDAPVTVFRAEPGEIAAIEVERQEVATATAWWAFFGVPLSMLAAVGGALVGTATPRVVGTARAP